MIDEVFLICLFVLVTGACIGSFLNVVALRAISKESIIFPSSKCPECNEPIKWYDNIPVLSYLFTFKGKCRNCGCKVSLQYPIVEALTAILFLAVFLAFGVTIKTLLVLILLCISIVITITDLKEHSTYDIHLWILIIMSIISSLYFNGLQKYTVPLIGLLTGVVLMEIIARAGYYLIKKDDTEENEENDNNVPFAEKLTYPIAALIAVGLIFVGYVMYGTNVQTWLICILFLASLIFCMTDVKKADVMPVFAVLIGITAIFTGICSFLNNYANPYVNLAVFTVLGCGIIKLITKLGNSIIEKIPVNGDVENKEIKQDEEIKEYVEENKRAFGEGDTYLAAASGALLGAVGFLISIFISIVLQALCILPQYIKSLFSLKKYRLLFVYGLIIIITALLLILPKLFVMDEFETYTLAACAVLLVLYMISVLKKTTNEQTFNAIPFGPAILISTFLTFFFGKYLVEFIYRLYSSIGA